MSIKTVIKNRLPFVSDWWRILQTPSKKRTYEALKQVIAGTPEIGRLFPEETMQSHYATKTVRNNIFHPDLYIHQIRYYRLYEYFKNHYADMLDPSTKIIEVGDSSGVLMRALGKKGISVDANPSNVAQICAKGLEAYEGSIYQLPFPDKSFDYAMSFQCLEHLEAPIFALKELARVAKKRVFVSIPYQPATKIYSKSYWDHLVKLPQDKGGWDVKSIDEHCDYHIFEFSSQDFKALLSYTDLECALNAPVSYFEPLSAGVIDKESYFNFFDLAVRPKA